jgi:hypothetical protein
MCTWCSTGLTTKAVMACAKRQSARAETFREFKYYATPNSETRVMKLASDFVLPALRKKLAVAEN